MPSLLRHDLPRNLLDIPQIDHRAQRRLILLVYQHPDIIVSELRLDLGHGRGIDFADMLGRVEHGLEKTLCIDGFEYLGCVFTGVLEDHFGAPGMDGEEFGETMDEVKLDGGLRAGDVGTAALVYLHERLSDPSS